MMVEPQMLLKDPGVFPSNEVLRESLGDDIYKVLESFVETITSEEYGLVPEWRFYNDGKAWLCKAVYKKKTVLWLSVWEGFFRVSFFFTEKHLEGITALEISETIKDEFAKAKPVGRLIPMIFDVCKKEQLDDLLTVVRHKKSLK
ncbi:DUF3788 family protein [Massilibacteroides sp.]|uniref:DUF3788 family protein n=1 Tax=Massilibacteroides sp. TaxID=2034766 RepID=UPI0026172B0C|nr:DUF3788 family protein [Massilibacteroides sp.]MDD4516154.1 DUF3788 family protein [Massilibacteroides sp.]